MSKKTIDLIKCTIVLFMLMTLAYLVLTNDNIWKENPKKLSDTIPLPISPLEFHELHNDGFIKSKLKVQSIQQDNTSVVIEGYLARASVSYSNQMPQIPIHIELVLNSNISLPKEISNGEELKNCILKGNISELYIGNEINVHLEKLHCHNKETGFPVEIKTEAYWKENNINNRVQGFIIEIGIKDSTKEYLKTNPKSWQEHMEYSIEHEKNVVWARVIPRKTKISIVFPLSTD
jgi:hypothetical protein